MNPKAKIPRLGLHVQVSRPARGRLSDSACVLWDVLPFSMFARGYSCKPQPSLSSLWLLMALSAKLQAASLHLRSSLFVIWDRFGICGKHLLLRLHIGVSELQSHFFQSDEIVA